MPTLAGGLPAPVMERWHDLTDGMDLEIHRRRQGGTYAEDRPIADFDEAYLLRHARICMRVAEWVGAACESAGVDAMLLQRGHRDCARLTAAVEAPLRIAASARATPG